MIALNEVQSAAVGAIIAGQAHGVKDAHGRLPHYACTTARALERAGYPAEVLAELEESGWLVGWDRKDGRFLTLSPEAAEASHVEIDEHLEFSAIDHPTRKRLPLGKLARGPDGKIPRDFDGRPLRDGPGGTIRRDPPAGKAVPERCQQAEPEPFWRPAAPAVDPITGKAIKPPKEPIRLPQRHRESYLGECGGIEPASREMSPEDQAIANEEYLMEEKRAVDGRLDIDPETEKPRRVPVLICGEMARIDPTLTRGRKRPKAKRKARAK